MADFSALKTAIQTYIKQNGNEEITGEILQEILLSVVTTLGDSAINDLVTALANEVAARQNADGTLQQNITNEATARGNADTALSNRLGSSITAENTAAEQIGAEAEARESADTALQGLIDGITDNIENGYVYAGIATPSSTPATGKVFYLALTAGTYTNYGSTEVSQGINILKYNGSAWSLDAFIGIDDTPTPNSPKLVKSGGAFDSVMTNGSAFDISAHFASGGTLATYANLSAALNALDTLSASYKRGGMSIKFVQSSDNKYVQYRLMSDTFNTIVGNWQGIDALPLFRSMNLPTSNGILTSILNNIGKPAIKGMVGKNKYDKNSPNLIRGYHIGKADGQLNPTQGWCVLPIYGLKVGWNYKPSGFNTSQLHVAYFNNTTYLSGELVESGGYLTIPSGCNITTISFQETDLDTFQLEEGRHNTEYEEYCIINDEYIIPKNTGYYVNGEYTVSEYCKNVIIPLNVGDLLLVDSATFNYDILTKVNPDGTKETLLAAESGALPDYKQYSYYCEEDITVIVSVISMANYREGTIRKLSKYTKQTYDFLEGKVITQTGELVDCRAYVNNRYYGYTTNPVPCKKGDVFEYSGVVYNSSYYAVYDIDGSVVQYETGNSYAKGADANGIAIPDKKTIIITDSNAAYVRFCTLDMNRNTHAQTSSIYEYYVYKYIEAVQKFKENQTREFIIDVKGHGDFDSIRGALIATKGLDSKENPIIFRVKSGLYENPLYVAGIGEPYCDNRYLSIIGDDKVNCILKTNNPINDYRGIANDNPCLRLGCGNIYVANMTFIATNDEPFDVNNGGSNTQYNTYCIHIDTDGSNVVGEDNIIEIHNCSFKNAHGACIGIGLLAHQSLIITNCDFETEEVEQTIDACRCVILLHDRPGSTDPQNIDAHFVMRDCTLRTTGQYVFKITTVHNAYQDLTFVNNVIQNNGTTPIMTTGSRYVKTPLCFGNNSDELNYI